VFTTATCFDPLGHHQAHACYTRHETQTQNALLFGNSYLSYFLHYMH